MTQLLPVTMLFGFLSACKTIEVDSNTGEILRTIDLDFTASRLAWLGLSEGHEHDHDH